MRSAILAIALALAATTAAAQNTTSGLQVVPGMSGESSGTVTGVGPDRSGAFGSPPDTRDVGAARGSTQGGAKGAGSNSGTSGAGRGSGTGTDKRGSASGGADPR